MAMEMAVESMEMAPGAIPRPGMVPEQRLLSPESRLRRRRRYGTFRGFLLGCLGFSTRRHLIGEEATRGGARGAHTTPGRGLAWPAPRLYENGLFWSIRSRIGPNFRSRIISIKFPTLLQKTSSSRVKLTISKNCWWTDFWKVPIQLQQGFLLYS